jgi:hypothetical protein
MESINKLIKSYDILSEKNGHYNSFMALKKHYSDICSNGDIIINKLIDGLDYVEEDYYKKLLDKYHNHQDFVIDLIDNYILITIESFIKNGLKPDPFWVETIINENLIKDN